MRKSLFFFFLAGCLQAGPVLATDLYGLSPFTDQFTLPTASGAPSAPANYGNFMTTPDNRCAFPNKVTGSCSCPPGSRAVLTNTSYTATLYTCSSPRHTEEPGRW